MDSVSVGRRVDLWCAYRVFRKNHLFCPLEKSGPTQEIFVIRAIGHEHRQCYKCYTILQWFHGSVSD